MKAILRAIFQLGVLLLWIPVLAQGDSLRAEYEISFASNMTGNGDIYIIDGLGRNLRQMTFENSVEGFPSWSADRSQIFFETNRNGNADIYAVQLADPTQLVQITSNPAGDYQPVVSPDGTQIAFVSDRNGNQDIFLMSIEGLFQRAPAPAASNESQPTWSPDGTRLAFVSDRDGNSELYVMNVDGSGLQRITESVVVDHQPSWSPDGRKLAFASDRDGDFDIYLLDFETRDVQKLTNNDVNDAWPSWSADGKLLLFASWVGDRYEAFVMRPNGSELEQLSTNFNITTPAWSPPALKILGLQVSSTDTEALLAQETVDLPNCGGTSQLTSIPSYVRSIERSVTLISAEKELKCKTTGQRTDLDVSLELPIIGFIRLSPSVSQTLQSQLCTSTEEYFFVREGETILQSRELILSAAPGTAVSYDIEWRLVTQRGQIELQRGERSFFVDFKLPEALRGIITASRQQPCP